MELADGDGAARVIEKRSQKRTAPLLLGAVKATAAALAGDPFGELGAWLQLLVAFDVIMLTAGLATYGYLLEDG